QAVRASVKAALRPWQTSNDQSSDRSAVLEALKVTANSPSQSQAVSGERPALGANIDDPVLSTEAFAQRLQIAAVRGHLFRERVALVLVEAGDKDSAQRAQSQLIAALEPRDVLAERAEGGLQALLWN